MKFKLFQPTEQLPPFTTKRTIFDGQFVEEEKAALLNALHSLLECLPQSNTGNENIERLCNTIMQATSHIRLIWIGFSHGNTDQVEPYATIGATASDARNWHLPKICFDYSGTYSQAALEGGVGPNEHQSLFAPWQTDMERCPANCALAIPLRSDQPGLRGLIVFYADDIDYFSHVGVASFQAFSHVAEIIWKQSSMALLLTQNAQIDSLTGLMSRRKTLYELEKGIEQVEKNNESLSIMLCRIEGFDKINESYGWVAADAVLQAFSKNIMSRLRPFDKVGRWNGVEFFWLLPRTNAPLVEALAQGLREYFASHTVAVKNWQVHLNISVGVATYSQQHNSVNSLIRQANHDMSNRMFKST